MADGLKIACPNFQFDLSNGSLVIGGHEHVFAIEQFSEADASFKVRISPASGLSEAAAGGAALMQADILCMHLDGSPVTPVLVEAAEDSWVFASACEGHVVRMEDKCG